MPENTTDSQTKAREKSAESADQHQQALRHIRVLIQVIESAAPKAFANGVTADNGIDEGEVLTDRVVKDAIRFLAQDQTYSSDLLRAARNADAILGFVVGIGAMMSDKTHPFSEWYHELHALVANEPIAKGEA